MTALTPYTPRGILAVGRRRKWQIVLPAIVIAATASWWIHGLPDRYRSQALLLAVPQRVPDTFVRPTVTTRGADRLQAITQQILSRTQLERIIQDFDLYADQRKTDAMQDIVDSMRTRDIEIRPVKGDAFHLGFAADSPDVAMRVVERLVSLFIVQTSVDRTRLAEGTDQFLEAQLEDARRRLIENESKLTEYRRRHHGALPTQLEANVRGLNSGEMQIQVLSDSLNRDRDRQLMLERSLKEADLGELVDAGARATPADPARLTAVEQLARAEAALEDLHASLTDQHPDIVAMKQTIADLRKRTQAESARQAESIQASAADALRRSRREELQAELTAVERQIAEKTADSEQSVLDVPPEDAGQRIDEAPAGPTDTSLAPGQRLGRYEVLDLLGSGGMGRVYRALDPTLGREVAIKALAPTFRGDPASLRRFEREARVLATLSHPNVATIYGFERLDGSPYLVLERVDGETLAHRLMRGAMGVDEALGVAGQIVAGLEEAHSKGVIHRDLKPSNVMLTPNGHVKLLDFGLAKTAGPRQASIASADPITSPGVVLGTARYMSPEQVKGEPLDSRSDVWAFGCVLYEMLSARPAFAGRSVSEVVAAVLRDDPDWQALPTTAPRTLRRLLRRCLRRDPRTRLQHVGDARLDLADAEDEPGTQLAGARSPGGSRRAPWLIAAAIVAGLGALLLVRFPRTAAAPHPARLSLELPARLALADEPSAPFAIAPAWSHIVFQAVEGGTQQLYVRELTDPAVRALPGTEGARQPFFSADGGWIGFFANRKLSKVPVGGGPVLPVADTGNNPRGGVWAPDGTIVFAAPQTAGLSRGSGSGGKPTLLTTLDKARGESSHRWPDLLPGGKWVLFTVGLEDAPYDEARIDAVSLETGERRGVIANASFARYSPDGRLLFVRGGHLHAVGFDRDKLTVRGTPEVVLEPVRYNPRNGGGHLAVSASGTLLYGPGEPTISEYFPAWVDREGRLTRASDPARPFRDVRASPDGRRIAAVIGTSTESDLWLVDANGTSSRLSFALSPHRPTWTSSGSGITVGAQKDSTWRLLTVAADGKGDPTVLFESPNRLYPNAWSRDGRYLMFQESRPESGWDLRVLDVDASGRPAGAA